MKKLFQLPLLCLPLLLLQQQTHAQLLKKLKHKVQQATGTKNTSTTNTGESSDQNTTGSPTNKTGAGLTNTPPPDVLQQITDAEGAHKTARYSDARYSIQQALVGVEIQIGRMVLKSLPATADNLPADTTQDKVMSTSYGWNNLTMQRIYSDKKDKQLTITIGNNILYAGMVDMYFNNTYVQANANSQNIKQTRVKGYKAIIQFDENKGYNLIVPLGQSSMIVWDCVNFADENEVMNTAGSFDIDGIKKMLGEQ